MFDLRLPAVVASAQEAAAVLVSISPCRIVRHHPEFRPVRSSYWPKPDIIVLRHNDTNTSERPDEYRWVSGWRGVCVMAHEIGHALDYHKAHPLQSRLTGRRSRYRDELAASSYREMVCRHWGLLRLKTVQHFDDDDWRYVARYKPQQNNPTIGVIRALYAPFSHVAA